MIFLTEYNLGDLDPMSTHVTGGHEVGGRAYPLGAPSDLVGASWLPWRVLQVLWMSSGPRKIIAKVLFRLDSVWYSFSTELQNKEKNRN